ncbi:glycosyltransferase family 4 protein [Azotobacter salinestris]|uniref:glycosyltransferase family 4 protein n=1 Tax=Azotobacter salinestris TaxID=69964 RepID=UPI001266B7FC|nr:glycosyltransferase family 4 protein [Azotobacter salinestris]
MKIAQIVPLYEAVPPHLYGGTERVVAHLTEALIELGHEVTLFASADSRTRARLVAMRKQALRLDPAPLKSDLASHLVLLQEVRRHADEFDVLHFHTDLLHFPFFEDMAGRTLTTVHGRLDMKDLSEAYRRWNAFPLASISEDQRKPLPFAHWHGTVHHGVDDERFHYHDQHDAPGDGYLAFLGRMSPEKRPDRAIAIAIRAGMHLKMAAKVDAADREYFERSIRPLLDHPLIEFLGEISDADKVELLGNASALLFPIDWPEPFGLVMIEAMACGTPVVAWRCGSVPEVIEQGVTGLIVDSDEQAVAAVHEALSLDRRRVRAAFERRFSSKIMASAYVDLYRRLPALAKHGLASAPPPQGGSNP